LELSHPTTQNMLYEYVAMASRYLQRVKSFPWIPYAVYLEPNFCTHVQKTTRYFIITYKKYIFPSYISLNLDT